MLVFHVTVSAVLLNKSKLTHLSQNFTTSVFTLLYYFKDPKDFLKRSKA